MFLNEIQWKDEYYKLSVQPTLKTYSTQANLVGAACIES